jgi:quercetin dioxygenase-like cupin family protein
LTRRTGTGKGDERSAGGASRHPVLAGNPGAPGPYVIRVRFAPGTMSPPHFHPEERQVVVQISGIGPSGTKAVDESGNPK